VRVALTRDPCVSPPLAERRSSPALYAAFTCKARVLVVDDNIINQKVAVRMLRKLGCQADIAGNGREALSLFDGRLYDLIIMDIQMPEVDGVTATTMIRKREASRGGHVPIVAVSAHAMVEERHRCLAAGSCAPNNDCHGGRCGSARRSPRSLVSLPQGSYPVPMQTDILKPLRWDQGALYLLEQRRLPGDEVWVRCDSAGEVHAAIRDMVVRGAPAIGCAAAYGVALAARALRAEHPELDAAEFLARLGAAMDHLATARPTAVNLFWAIEQMRQSARDAGGPEAIAAALEARAVSIQQEDIAMCERIGDWGAALIPDGATVLTHCNAGALATGGYGTALGVLRSARRAGKTIKVLADETRPYLQGSRLTAWELMRDGFDVTIIPDSAAAALLRKGEIQCCVVGADRIAACGDVANKIGTYGVALAAYHNGVPFYVAASISTIDLKTPSGDAIPIEERSGSEMFAIGTTPIAPAGVTARYPAFDVTPAELVSAIITDRGVMRAPYSESLLACADG
jgi:methylthioribose-1-phosphate isomerase